MRFFIGAAASTTILLISPLQSAQQFIRDDDARRGMPKLAPADNIEGWDAKQLLPVSNI